MKKRSIVISIVMALLMLVITPIAVLADTGDDTADVEGAAIRDGLAIVAPLATRVDTEISITVFRCSDQEPVAGAGVWLIARDRAEELRQAAAEVEVSEDPDAAQDEYERLLDLHGTLLGRTDDRGKVWYTFEEGGRYVLVAAKRGYLPDSRSIAVGVYLRALGIDAPRRAEVGENVTINVFQRGTGDAVKDAGVWAFSREDAESLRAEISTVRESGDQDALESTVNEACDLHGIFLGTTNGAGKVHHAFEDAGGYLLVTCKPGYFPGWKGIMIVDPAAADSLAADMATDRP
jgi:hypothetical protein